MARSRHQRTAVNHTTGETTSTMVRARNVYIGAKEDHKNVGGSLTWCLTGPGLISTIIGPFKTRIHLSTNIRTRVEDSLNRGRNYNRTEGMDHDSIFVNLRCVYELENFSADHTHGQTGSDPFLRISSAQWVAPRNKTGKL